MIGARFFQQITLSSLLLCCAQTTFANPLQLTTCPSVEELRSFAFSGAIPIGFNAQTNKLHYLTILVGATPQLKDYGLFVSPVDAAPGESPEASIPPQLAALHSNSDTPISNTIFISDDLSESVKMCTYSSDDNSIYAILYVEEDSEDTDVNRSDTVKSSGPALRRFTLGHP